MLQLFNHQKEFLLKNPDKSALVWSCGTGKTLTAIEWAKSDTALIIVPKPLKTNWEREALKDCVVLTKEEFRRDIKSLPKYSQVIVDEVHAGFLTPNFKSQMSKALRWYLNHHKVPRVLLLSATVYTSSPWNIYNLGTYLGYNWNWQDFNRTFFNLVWMGRRQIPVPKKGVEIKLASIVKNIASVVNIYDCMDVPLQLHTEPEYFALSKKQEKAIKENYDPVPIVRYTLQHEIENGILIGNDFRTSETYACDKNERILALVKENPKVAIVCRYNMQIDVLSSLLKEYTPLVIRGDVKDRDAITLQAEKVERCVVLIQADCAEGYQLPSFGLCIFASQSYSYTKWEQITGRFLRMDKPSRTTFVYLLTEGDSIDQAVFNSVKRKEDFKINLYKK